MSNLMISTAPLPNNHELANLIHQVNSQMMSSTSMVTSKSHNLTTEELRNIIRALESQQLQSPSTTTMTSSVTTQVMHSLVHDLA